MLDKPESPMHVLEYLKDPKCEKKPKDSLYAEYRLLSSGTLHHACVGDWSKSEGARTLLAQPLFLFAVSRPFDEYPLELALQLTVPQVEEEQTKTGPAMFMFYPDDEVVRDLAALLKCETDIRGVASRIDVGRRKAADVSRQGVRGCGAAAALFSEHQRESYPEAVVGERRWFAKLKWIAFFAPRGRRTPKLSVYNKSSFMSFSQSVSGR
jgi:hypothetical protein